MTSSIPDGISFSDLQALAANAREESRNDEKDTELSICDLPVHEFHDVIKEKFHAINQEFSHPMTAKVQALEALATLMDWHTSKGQTEFTDTDAECGTAWLRDAGKLQAAMSILVDVILPDDYVWQREMSSQVQRFNQEN